MKELTIHLRSGSKTPLYEQIYQYIKKDMADGKISPGEKLPSTRFLAKHLQVSRSTTALAYDQLLSEGYLKTVPGSGYFACDMKELYQNTADPKMTLCQPAAEQKHFKYDFSPHAIEWSDFSMAAWRKAVKSMMQEDMNELFLPGNSMGEENLRQVISEYLHQARGVNCSLHQIVIGAGNEYLLMLLYQMLEHNVDIAMESPTYRQASGIFQNLGWQVCPVPMDEEGIRLEKLRDSGAHLVYIMPSHQFPMGTVMPLRRRMELLDWAGSGEERYIIEDDYDSEFRYRGKPIPSLQGSDPFNCVIYLGTFSKSIAPAIRVSYMVLPPKLAEIYHRRCGFYSSTVSRMQQQTLFHFMKDGYFERHLNKMRRIYRARHDCLMAELKNRAWVEKIYGDNGGLHILIRAAGNKAEKEIVEQAERHQVRIYGLNEYTLEEKEDRKRPPVLLLGYGGLTEAEIKEGIQRLQEAMESL